MAATSWFNWGIFNPDICGSWNLVNSSAFTSGARPCWKKWDHRFSSCGGMVIWHCDGVVGSWLRIAKNSLGNSSDTNNDNAGETFPWGVLTSACWSSSLEGEEREQLWGRWWSVISCYNAFTRRSSSRSVRPEPRNRDECERLWRLWRFFSHCAKERY